MIKVVFFAPYPDVLPVTEQVFRERPESKAIQYEVVQNFYDNKLEQVETDMVITRGFTVHTLKRKNIPYAELKSTRYGVMKAVNECVQKENIERIAVMDAFNMVYEAKQMCHLCPNLGLGYYAGDDETKLEMAMHQAMRDRNQVIVGGYSTVQIAERLGMPAIMIHSGIKAVNHAISEVITVAHLTRYERQKRDGIANVMNYSFQGIISVSRKGIVTLANTYCHTCMKDRKTSLVGEHMKDFFPDTDFDSVIKDKQKILSEACRFGGKQVLASRVPVAGDSEEFGYVLIFQGTEQIQAEEGKLRECMHPDDFTAGYDFSHILYRDSCIGAVISQAVKFNYSDSNILVRGETGTGKKLFAQNIHNSNHRRKGPFVAINYAALPENLLESELFGCVEGAFTGASRSGEMGFFEIAHKGTVFLDEVGDILPRLQNRLLRVVQERGVIRLGNDIVIPVDVRVICATNRDLKKEVSRGNFREDLLHRLGVLKLSLPPLGKQKQDILCLTGRMVRFEHECTGSRLETVAQEGRGFLMHYSWPGDAREMRNFCERICIPYEKTRAGAEGVLQALPGEQEHGEEADSQYADSQYAESQHAENWYAESRYTEGRYAESRHADSGSGSTDFPASGSHVPAEVAGCGPRLEETRRQAMKNALELYGYHRNRTAAYPGIDKNTLWRKMKKYGIEGQTADKKHRAQGLYRNGETL